MHEPPSDSIIALLLDLVFIPPAQVCEHSDQVVHEFHTQSTIRIDHYRPCTYHYVQIELKYIIQQVCALMVFMDFVLLQVPLLQLSSSVLFPVHVPPLLSEVILVRVFLRVPSPQVSEQSDQDCHDAHVQLTEMLKK